ncbi:hypothetical protein MDA_GLEAN10025358 [Myotis davidii]|uniref:Uncharacterized protein n=1 Tax=Myotis davidii TaxID=225400 RepID=L5M1V1_MYODS|nr:hypothetical protein MDA_GLEAN10025358 [Myotis davidii]
MQINLTMMAAGSHGAVEAEGLVAPMMEEAKLPGQLLPTLKATKFQLYKAIIASSRQTPGEFRSPHGSLEQLLRMKVEETPSVQHRHRVQRIFLDITEVIES